MLYINTQSSYVSINIGNATITHLHQGLAAAHCFDGLNPAVAFKEKSDLTAVVN